MVGFATARRTAPLSPVDLAALHFAAPKICGAAIENEHLESLVATLDPDSTSDTKIPRRSVISRRGRPDNSESSSASRHGSGNREERKDVQAPRSVDQFYGPEPEMH